MAGETRDLLSWLATLEPLPALLPDVTDADLLPLDEPDLRIDEPAAWRSSATTPVGP